MTVYLPNTKKRFDPISEMLWLSLNILGVSPFKNAKEYHGFKSILARFKLLRGNIVYLLAICYSKGRPVSLDFMKESMQAFQSLFDTGLEGTMFYLQLICCDLPAKAFVNQSDLRQSCAVRSQEIGAQLTKQHILKYLKTP